MTIELTPEQETLIEEQLASGCYPDERAVVQDALELLRRNSEAVAKVQEGYRRGKADLEAGRSREIAKPEQGVTLADQTMRPSAAGGT